jgi:putative DNA methylase
VDKWTQYYVLFRYEYGEAGVEFDEANVLARGVGVELDAPGGLTEGARALAKKDKSTIALRTYRERGEHEQLGLAATGNGSPALVDVLHRLLWLLDHESHTVPDFLTQAQPDVTQLRLVAQALAGRALAAEPTPGQMLDQRTTEQHAIDRLLAAWRRIVEENLFVR